MQAGESGEARAQKDKDATESYERVPIGIHDNPVTFTYFFQFRIKSMGECIGVFAMACKRIKHKKHRETFVPAFFRYDFCFSGTTF